MSRYMVQVSYTKEAAAALVKKPEDRTVAVRSLIEAMGGRLLDFYFTFGDYDVVLIAELPDNTAALASDLAAVVAGHVSKIKTTVLLSPEEGVAAMKKAAGVTMKAPGA
jgi:uncharacterized protein with GYD domain